jgi:hypothetical protein
MAKNNAHQHAVPAAARSRCRPILPVRSDRHPPRATTGTTNSRQIAFWKSSSTPVDVCCPDTLASVPTSATQKNAAVVRNAPAVRFSVR